MTGALCPVNSLDSSRETLVTLRVVVLEADLELNLEDTRVVACEQGG